MSDREVPSLNNGSNTKPVQQSILENIEVGRDLISKDITRNIIINQPDPPQLIGIPQNIPY